MINNQCIYFYQMLLNKIKYKHIIHINNMDNKDNKDKDKDKDKIRKIIC